MKFYIDYIKSLFFKKSFWLGVIITLGIFSKYIFGPNNFLEEVAELLIKVETDQDINLSPNTPEKFDMNKLYKMRR